MEPTREFPRRSQSKLHPAEIGEAQKSLSKLPRTCLQSKTHVDMTFVVNRADKG